MNLSRLAWLMQMPHTYAKCVSDQIGLIRLYLTDAISLHIISYFDTYILYYYKACIDMSYQYFTVITNDFHCEVSYKILG